MIFPLRLNKMLGFVVFIICVMIMFTTTIVAQIPSINVKVADTTASPGAQNTAITIFSDNIFDEVAGFNLWIQLERPNVMIFQTDTITVYDTTFWNCIDTNLIGVCVDSIGVFSWEPYEYFYDTVYLDTIGNFDTTGCLTSGWEFIDSRSISKTGYDINIVGIADMPGGSVVPPIPAGQQGGVLLRILADVFSMDDTVIDRTVNMIVQTQFKDHFSYSRSDGSSITWLTVPYLDTTCYECTQWVDTVCTAWLEVPRTIDEPINLDLCLDSMEILTKYRAVLDSVNVNVTDGSLTVMLSAVCGNINGSEDGNLDISDLIYLLDYMFGNPTGPAPQPYESGNVDCLGIIDISDLIYLVNHMFGNPSGPAPCANCP